MYFRSLLPQKYKMKQPIATFVIFFFLISSAAHGQKLLTYQTFDQLKNYEAQIDSLKWQANAYLGSTMDIASDYDLALKTSQFALSKIKQSDTINKCNFSLYTGISFYNLAQFDSAIHYLEQANQYALSTQNTLNIATSSASLIAMYMQFQKEDKAKAAIETLNNILDSTNNKMAQSKCYSGLSYYYYFKSFYLTAQDFFQKNITLLTPIADTSKDNRLKMEWAVQHYMLYKIYINLELYQKGIDILKAGSKLMNISPILTIRYSSAFVEAYTTDSIANIEMAKRYYATLAEFPSVSKKSSEYVMSNIAMTQYYAKQKQFEEAKKYLDKALAFATESGSIFLIHQAENIHGIYKYYQGKYSEAIVHLEKALPTSKKINLSNYLESLHLLSICYKQIGNLAKALNLSEQFIEEQGDYVKMNMNRTFADQEVRFNVMQQQDKIKTLSAENTLRELSLKDAQRDKFLLIIGLSAVIVIVVLLYRNNRSKSKLYAKLQEQNKALDIANEKLAVANQNKAKLFGIFSHDLRSPISKIAQYLTLQKADPNLFDTQQKEAYNTKLINATSNLLETMEDLLLWSKSQMEYFSPEIVATNLHQIIQSESILHRELAEEKGIEIANQVGTNFNPPTDENCMRIIVRNLLSNAIKYSSNQSTIRVYEEDNKLFITNTHSNIVSIDELNYALLHPNIKSTQRGLGLQLTKDLAEKINVKIQFASYSKNTITAVIAFQN